MNNDYDDVKYIFPPSLIQTQSAIAVAMNRCKSYGFNSKPCIDANTKANQLSEDYVTYNTVVNMPKNSYDEKTEIPVMIENYSDAQNPLEKIRDLVQEKVNEYKKSMILKLVGLIILVCLIMLIIYHLMTRSGTKYSEI